MLDTQRMIQKFKSNENPSFHVHIIKEADRFRYAICVVHEKDLVPLKVSRPYQSETEARFGASVIENHFKHLFGV